MLSPRLQLVLWVVLPVPKPFPTAKPWPLAVLMVVLVPWLSTDHDRGGGRGDMAGKAQAVGVRWRSAQAFMWAGNSAKREDAA